LIKSEKNKEIAAWLRSGAEFISARVADAFEQAVVGRGSEILFFRELIANLKRRLEPLRIPGARFSCRLAEIHQKPIVETPNYRCELGDLLMVVKYHPIEADSEVKSIIYQVKMADKGSSNQRCKLDKNQLNLLTRWPEFRFGRKADGGTRAYRIAPSSLEFGSYLLAPRSARQGQVLTPWEVDTPLDFGTASLVWKRSYGLGPTAWDCYAEGTASIPLTKSAHLVADVDAVVGHLLFSKGENHLNSEVRELVAALYRYVGLDPDPPAEFDGFSTEPGREKGFAVLEVNVEQTASLYEVRKKKIRG
jgi:hypothetical protein